MKTKHTPGPWELSYDKGSTRDVIASKGSEPICMMRQSWVSRDAYSANSKLVAAAPNLLAAAIAALEYLEAHRPKGNIREQFAELNAHENGAVKPLREAITKATQ